MKKKKFRQLKKDFKNDICPSCGSTDYHEGDVYYDYNMCVESHIYCSSCGFELYYHSYGHEWCWLDDFRWDRLTKKEKEHPQRIFKPSHLALKMKHKRMKNENNKRFRFQR